MDLMPLNAEVSQRVRLQPAAQSAAYQNATRQSVAYAKI